MSAPDIIETLVETFAANLDAYKSGAFNEAQARIQFINPMLTALGWDVSNRAGYAEAYKDVIHEDSLRIGSAVKAPDYCCRIGGMRKFFVEAKKPSVNIREDVHPAYQLRRYAWSAKLPLSILTDFEEFAVYDCRVRPVKMDKASTARVMYMRFEDYPERWHEIADIFSREAILKGSFDKYAESHKKKHGTASVDAAFLAEIERWREQLAKNIAMRNPALSQRELNHAVQQTIDRIIFLRIAEDRGIEDYGRLMALQNGQDVYKRMLEQFREADAKYNSGLFHFHHEKGRAGFPDELSPSLVMDDKVLKPILKSLYYPDSPYEFSVLPADILGQTYEQFLGKVIRLTAGHRAVVENKPEVKKAGGVYYTPTYIVDYIVQHTVGKLLEGKTSRQVAKLRICDPACGSGSFLLGAYQYLLDWHLKWYVENNPEKWAKGRDPKIYQVLKGEWRLTTAEKKRILLNNIYGVDIDQQAVEVTKLSLLLKVLENETQDTLGRQMSMFHERALPDLASNIKCGNSLIGPDFYDQQDLGLMDEEERYRINVFDWQAEFPDIFTGKTPGFDAVIGNPPYVVLGNDLFTDEVTSYLQQYRVAQYKTDLFHLFIEKGIGLVKESGYFGYIIPNPWLTMQFTNRLRKYVLGTTVEEIVIFDHRVFYGADVHTALLLLRNRTPKVDHKAIIKRPQTINTASKIEATPANLIAQKAWLSSDDARIETRLIGALGELISKITGAFPRLGDVARASLGCQAYNSSKHTPEQIANRVFHSESKLSDDYLPELAGNDVSRYAIKRTRGKWIKYGPWLHDYRTMDWLTGPRILIREIPASAPYRIQASYVEDTYCNYKTILNVNPSEQTKFSMKFLTGLLNSRLLSFIYPYISNKMVAQSFPRLSVRDIRNLPIRTIDFADSSDKARHDRMVDLIERMLALHKQFAAAKTGHGKTLLQRQIDATDRQIDRLVYALYELTNEELKMVDEEIA